MATINPLRNMGHFGLAQHTRNMWTAHVPPEATEKDLISREFWVHVAHKLHVGDDIKCLAIDGSYVCNITVLFVQGTDTKMGCTGFHRFERPVDDGQSLHPDYEVKNGGATGWYIKHTKTGERLFDKGFKTQAKALTELEEYLTALAS